MPCQAKHWQHGWPMQLNELTTKLKQGLAPLYLLASDEPVLLADARELIIKKANALGLTQRVCYYVEPGFSWETVYAQYHNLSLFTNQCIIDLRLPKWDEQATRLVKDYAEHQSPELVLILSMQKLTSAQQKTKWYKAVQKTGETVVLWPIRVGQFPDWIRHRFAAQQLRLTSPALERLSEWAEGNLLLVDQTITKLRLTTTASSIDLPEIETMISDSARFTVFDLIDAIYLGDPGRAKRILNYLAADQAEPTLLVWMLSKSIRHLVDLQRQRLNGVSEATLLQKEWKSKVFLLKKALHRLSYPKLLNSLSTLSEIDLCIKGQRTGDVWHALTVLSTRLAK